MADDSFPWTWNGCAFRIGLTRLGSGPAVLLLPALSSISTRAEMALLQARLSDRFATVALDLPGFGSEPKPAMAWQPAAYCDFVARALAHFAPFATVAAGHTASYALERAVEAPGSAGRLVLINPTWRGPLPTMLGRRAGFLGPLARAADRPLLGALLYRLNVNTPVIKMMARGHVYADPDWLGGERLAEKLRVTNAPGARHASVRFVCGELDPLAARDGFLGLARRLRDDVLVLYGTAAPRRSLGEITALGGLPHIRLVPLRGAKLAVHEEFPEPTANAVLAFLSEPAAARPATPKAASSG
jgi:pimeloyl-ACP methyl ester carboxylesterase